MSSDRIEALRKRISDLKSQLALAPGQMTAVSQFRPVPPPGAAAAPLPSPTTQTYMFASGKGSSALPESAHSSQNGSQTGSPFPVSPIGYGTPRSLASAAAAILRDVRKPPSSPQLWDVVQAVRQRRAQSGPSVGQVDAAVMIQSWMRGHLTRRTLIQAAVSVTRVCAIMDSLEKAAASFASRLFTFCSSTLSRFESACGSATTTLAQRLLRGRSCLEALAGCAVTASSSMHAYASSAPHRHGCAGFELGLQAMVAALDVFAVFCENKPSFLTVLKSFSASPAALREVIEIVALPSQFLAHVTESGRRVLGTLSDLIALRWDTVIVTRYTASHDSLQSLLDTFSQRFKDIQTAFDDVPGTSVLEIGLQLRTSEVLLPPTSCIDDAFVSTFLDAEQRVVMWSGAGTCDDPSSCKLGLAARSTLPYPLPCRMFVCSDGVLVLGDIPSRAGSHKTVICDFAPIGQAILVFDTSRDSVSITLSGALIVRLKLEPGTGKTAALAVTQAKERLQSAVAVVQEMDIVRGRVPSRSRVASSVGAIRSRFRECMEDYTASVAAVNRLLQQTTLSSRSVPPGCGDANVCESTVADVTRLTQRLRGGLLSTDKILGQLHALGALLAAHSTSKQDLLALNATAREALSASVSAQVPSLMTQSPASAGVKMLSLNPLRAAVKAQQALELLDDDVGIAPQFRSLQPGTGDLKPVPPSLPPPPDVITANPYIARSVTSDSKNTDSPDFKPLSPTSLPSTDNRNVVVGNPLTAHSNDEPAGHAKPTQLMRRSSVKLLAETKSVTALTNLSRSPEVRLSFAMWVRTGTLMKGWIPVYMDDSSFEFVSFLSAEGHHILDVNLTRIASADEAGPVTQYIKYDKSGVGRACPPPTHPFMKVVLLQGCVVMKQSAWHTDTVWTQTAAEAARLCHRIRFYKERYDSMVSQAERAASGDN